MNIPSPVEVRINDRDLRWSFSRGSGPGGQHRNKTDSAVRLEHIPTGIIVTCENERSQYLNKQLALEQLRARIKSGLLDEIASERVEERKRQVGTGMRADKRRTIRVRDDSVKDHESGKQIDIKSYLRGDLRRLH